MDSRINQKISSIVLFVFLCLLGLLFFATIFSGCL